MEFQHELVIPDEGLPFKFFLFEGSQGNYVREKHWHTSIEIFAVMEGSLTFYLNDEKHPLKAGELMIINSNEVHSIDSPEENHTAVLQIPLKQFEDYFTAHRFIRFAANEQETDSQLWRLYGKCINYTASEEPGMSLRFVPFIMMYCICWSTITVWMRRESRKCATAAVWMRLQELLPI